MTTSMDVGAILRSTTNPDKVIRVKPGSSIQNLLFVDVGYRLKKITGIVKTVKLGPTKDDPNRLTPIGIVINGNTGSTFREKMISFDAIRDFDVPDTGSDEEIELNLGNLNWQITGQLMFTSSFTPTAVFWNGTRIEPTLLPNPTVVQSKEDLKSKKFIVDANVVMENMRDTNVLELYSANGGYIKRLIGRIDFEPTGGSGGSNGSWNTGDTDPSPDLSAPIGAIYLNTSSLELFQMTDVGWVSVGSIKGEKGDKGDKGEKGDPGEDGADGKNAANFRPRGEWAASTEYVNNDLYIDIVSNNGSSYLCVNSHISGDTFEMINWMVLAEKGATGGDTPSIEIGENGNWWINGVDTGCPSVPEIVTERLDKLEGVVEELTYEPIEIISFTHNAGIKEIGSTAASVTLTWNLNKDPASQNVDGTPVSLEARQYTIGTANLTGNKTYTLTVTDDKDTSVSKTTTVTFLNGVYYGVGSVNADNTNNDFIQSLTKVLSDTRVRDFTVTANTGEYIFYCIPSRLGTPTFFVGGFEGGFDLLKNIAYTNPSGYEEDYAVYRSVQTGLGKTTVNVK